MHIFVTILHAQNLLNLATLPRIIITEKRMHIIICYKYYVRNHLPVMLGLFACRDLTIFDNLSL